MKFKPVLRYVSPPPGVDIIEVGIMKDGVEYGRTKGGELVKLDVKEIEITESEAQELMRQLGR